MSEAGNLCPRPDLLVALEEDVLPAALAESVRRHVAACAVCTQLQKDLRDDSLAQPTLANVEKVRAKVFAAPPAHRFRATHYAGLAIAAGALLCILFVTRDRHTGQGVRVSTAPVQARIEPPALPPAVPRSYRLALQPAPLRLPLTAMVLRGQQEDRADDYWKQLGAALDPYRAGRYPEAISKLTALAQRFPKAVEPPFYEGVAQLLAGDANAALPRLERAREIGGEALNADIRWYRAVAFERTANWMAAVPLLSELCRADNPYRQQACQAASLK